MFNSFILLIKSKYFNIYDLMLLNKENFVVSCLIVNIIIIVTLIVYNFWLLKLKTDNHAKISLFDKEKQTIIPSKSTKGSAGLDFFQLDNITIPPYTVKAISTNIVMEIPKGYYGMLALRSSIAKKNEITLLGGIIDSDYRGEIKIFIKNNRKKNIILEEGKRYVQMIIAKTYNHPVTLTDMLIIENDNDRKEGGFGSTGK